MQGYKLVRGPVKGGTTLRRRATNARAEQYIVVLYCTEKFILTRGLLDNEEEVQHLPTQTVYYEEELLEND